VAGAGGFETLHSKLSYRIRGISLEGLRRLGWQIDPPRSHGRSRTIPTSYGMWRFESCRLSQFGPVSTVQYA
jgi:hypothetical protein